MNKNIAILGCTGAIGSSFIRQCVTQYPNANIYGFGRKTKPFNSDNLIFHQLDNYDEDSLETAANIASQNAQIDMVIVATGMLHDDNMMPEKSLRDLSAKKFQQLYEVNTIIPALAAKHFTPKLNRDNISIFAAISARVGSISDNQLGGWYAYRAAKAALNMVIKNTAIETSRRNQNAIIVGLHPGTVDSDLSKPFQSHVDDGKLFTADFSAQQLLNVLDNLQPSDSGKCFAWDGKEIQP